MCNVAISATIPAASISLHSTVGSLATRLSRFYYIILHKNNNTLVVSIRSILDPSSVSRVADSSHRLGEPHDERRRRTNK
jgi:hypothetical protein